VLFQDLEHAGFFYQATYPLSQISGCTYPFEKPLLIHQRQNFLDLAKVVCLRKGGHDIWAIANTQGDLRGLSSIGTKK
jgi:hypothetical protein